MYDGRDASVNANDGLVAVMTPRLAVSVTVSMLAGMGAVKNMSTASALADPGSAIVPDCAELA